MALPFTDRRAHLLPVQIYWAVVPIGDVPAAAAPTTVVISEGLSGLVGAKRMAPMLAAPVDPSRAVVTNTSVNSSPAVVPSAIVQTCIISVAPEVGVVALVAVIKTVPAPRLDGVIVEVVPEPRFFVAVPRANCP